jgi:hypothetical protein
MLAPIHLHLVDRLPPQPGERWLDLATKGVPGDYVLVLGRRR